MTRPPKSRLGIAGYARLLAEFKKAPAGIGEMHQRAGIGRDTAYRLIPQLHAGELLHVCGWRVEPRRQATPIYAYGPGADVPAPASRANGRPVLAKILKPRRIASEMIAMCLLMEGLQEPTAVYELHEETGIHRDTIRHLLDAMREGGLARIASWHRRDTGGGKYVARWILGEGEDAPYPKIRRRIQQRRAGKAYRERLAALRPALALQAALAPANDGMRSAA